MRHRQIEIWNLLGKSENRVSILRNWTTAAPNLAHGHTFKCRQKTRHSIDHPLNFFIGLSQGTTIVHTAVRPAVEHHRTIGQLPEIGLRGTIAGRMHHRYIFKNRWHRLCQNRASKRVIHGHINICHCRKCRCICPPRKHDRITRNLSPVRHNSRYIRP